MHVSTLLAFASVVLGALAALPGSLGILKFTHRLTARPAGAFFVYVVSVPVYVAAAAALAGSVYLTATDRGHWWVAAFGGVGFGGLSVFGFLMHTRFMFRPVRRPTFVPAREAVERFGDQEEVIGVLDRRGLPFAFVARLARRPHVVWQPDGVAPFIATHCVLSHSSAAYEVDETFAADQIYISSVLANNLVFYDRGSHCSILQIENQSTDGRRQLKRLPTVMTSLGAWRQRYPDSPVWVREAEWRDTFYLKLLARASVVDPASQDLVYPLEAPPDTRLALKEYVMGVRVNGAAKAYPLSAFRQTRITEDMVGGEPIVFFSAGGGDLVTLFSRRHPAGVLSFEPVGDDCVRDATTSSVWTMAGECVSGPLAGFRLTPTPHYNKIFWCVWADFFPATAVASAA